MARTGDYGGLGGLLDAAAAERRAELDAPPVACPNDGEPLVVNAAGVRRCPFDGWQWDGVTR